MSENEKIDLKPGDEIRITFRGNGKFSIQLERQPKTGSNVTLLNSAKIATIEEVADYLKRVL